MQDLLPFIPPVSNGFFKSLKASDKTEEIGPLPEKDDAKESDL